ncbi:YegP family protein [Litchfieldella xinjiangensis]
MHAGNGQVIGVSETYSSTSARETGINSVKANGPSAVIHDRT